MKIVGISYDFAYSIEITCIIPCAFCTQKVEELLKMLENYVSIAQLSDMYSL